VNKTTIKELAVPDILVFPTTDSKDFFRSRFTSSIVWTLRVPLLNFSTDARFFYFDALAWTIAISTISRSGIRRAVTSSHRCIARIASNPDEDSDVTLAQRGENDSM
jgi:hypothetical protein